MKQHMIRALAVLVLFAGAGSSRAESGAALSGGALPEIPQFTVAPFTPHASGARLEPVAARKPAKQEDEEEAEADDAEEEDTDEKPRPVDAAIAELNFTLGNPTGATEDPGNETNYLMEKNEYVLSYNNVTHNPNWVSWHVNSSWIGTLKRADSFREDPALNELAQKRGWLQVMKADYKNTGYDRGHMCNSKDRTKNPASNDQTFFMTNMVPQAPSNNQKTWMWLETVERELAQEEGNEREVFMVSGPAGRGGDGVIKGKKDKDTGVKQPDIPTPAEGLPIKRNAKGTWSEKGQVVGEINVPKCVWKVIVAMPEGKTSASDVTRDADVIAVIMPNSESIKHAKKEDWKKYIVSIAQVEQMLAATTPKGNMKWPTQYHFLSNVRSDVAQALKQKTYENLKNTPVSCN